MSTEQQTPQAQTQESAIPVLTPDQQADKFKGFATKDGEVLDPMNTGDTPEKPVVPAKPKAKAKAQAPAEGEEGEEVETPDGEEKPKPRRSKAQDRIDQAIARQRAAERRADQAETLLSSVDARLKAIEQGTLNKGAPAPISDPAAPKPETYEYGELDARYIRDLARYEVRKEFEVNQTRANNETQSKAQAEMAEQRASKLSDFTSKGAELYEDFDEVVVQSAQDGLWPLSPTLGELILESDVGHAIAYELATDVKLARSLNKMPLAKQAVWFGQAEARLSDKGEPGKPSQDKPAVRVPSAPPPPRFKARGAGDSNPPSPDTSDFAAFERMANGS